MNRQRGQAGIPILIAITLVVAALYFIPPLFRRFDSKAALTASAANLAQWGIALNLHLADNNDRLPEVGGGLPDPERPLAWYNSLPVYLSLEPLTKLPPAERPKPGMKILWVDPQATESEAKRTWGDYFFCYGMNYWLQPIPEEAPPRIYILTDPSSTLFLTQTAGPRPGIAPADVQFRSGDKKSPETAVPVLFTDGHVAMRTRRQLTDSSIPDYAALWLPFADAPNPDYEEVSIQPLFPETTP